MDSLIQLSDGFISATSQEMFHPLASREYYRTESFEELAFQLTSKLSYREAAKILNRFRRSRVLTLIRT